jgi:cytochrome c-type biogenesis protein CcmH/NrfG
MESLATGIRAKGLHDLMARAEDLMRQDKFATAIEQYDQAGRVAPNNPLVWLGRAIAELGAGYYAQADRDIRQVFRADPALLLAQVDLNKMMNADRLNFLRQDLSTLAANDPKDARPWFLQAFIAYNTGNASEAQHHLDEAEKRSGRADWTIRLLRNHWSLPGTGRPQTEGNTNTPPPANPGAAEAPTTRPAELNK